MAYVRSGGEFLVNTTTATWQTDPGIAVLSNGGFSPFRDRNRLSARQIRGTRTKQRGVPHWWGCFNLR